MIKPLTPNKSSILFDVIGSSFSHKFLCILINVSKSLKNDVESLLLILDKHNMAIKLIF